MHELTGAQKAFIMAGVMLGLFLAALDQTIVSTAMPRIVASLGGLDYFSWVVTSYLLASTVAVPVVGKLSDIYGRKPFYIVGVAIFLVGSVLSGISQTMLQLVIFRGVLGLGGGVLFANAFAVIGDIFPPSERGKWQGIVGGTFALASVLGPLLGGTLTEQLSWRWVFWVNLPVGVVTLIALWRFLPWWRPEGVSRSIDYLGVATLIGWVVPLLLTFVWVGDSFDWWSLEMNALLGLVAVLLAVFLWVESRAEEPLVPLDLFRNRIYSVSATVSFLVGAAMFGGILYVPLFLQAVNGLSPTKAGLAMIPMSAALITASTLTGQVVSRTGHYKIPAIIGGALLPVGLWLLTDLNSESSTLDVMVRVPVVGLGIGPGLPVFTVAAQNAVPYRLLGVATSSLQFFRTIGGSIGVAILGSVLATRLAAEAPDALSANVRANTPPELLARVTDPQLLLSPVGLGQARAGFEALGPQGLQLFGEAMLGLRVALAESVAAVFAAAVVFSLIALVATFLLREIPLRTTVLDAAELASQVAGGGEAQPGGPTVEPSGAAGS